MNYPKYWCQSIHDAACKTKAEKITIELSTFKKIDTTLQQAWEQAKITQRNREESRVLDALKQIQESITGLEQKYEDIQAKVTEAPKRYAETVFRFIDPQTKQTDY